MTSDPASPQLSPLARLSGAEADRAARWWHLATAVLAGGSLLLQLVVVVTSGPQTVGVRLVRFVSYFSIESNLLVFIGTVMLVRDRRRDGAVWRAIRLSGLVSITVTGLIYVLVLRPVVAVDGWAVVAGSGLHYAVPVLVVLGWALFGPRERIHRLDVLAALTWPMAWFAWTLAHGAVTRFYPYPFIDVCRTRVLVGAGPLRDRDPDPADPGRDRAAGGPPPGACRALTPSADAER